MIESACLKNVPEWESVKHCVEHINPRNLSLNHILRSERDVFLLHLFNIVVFLHNTGFIYYYIAQIWKHKKHPYLKVVLFLFTPLHVFDLVNVITDISGEQVFYF